MDKEKLYGQEDHDITEREASAYRDQKDQQPLVRGELPRDKVKLFLRLVSGRPGGWTMELYQLRNH